MQRKKEDTLYARAVRELSQMTVQIQEDLRLDIDAKEAIVFSLLVNEALFGICNNAPSATGA